MPSIDLNGLEEWQKAQRGELYRAFVPELVAVRDECYAACTRFNTTTDGSRRNLVELFRQITGNPIGLPPKSPTTSQEEDEEALKHEPWVIPPLRADYGINIKLGQGTFLNANSTFVDTCPIQIGQNCLFGPNCSFYSGGHPLDPAVRDGLRGPEFGKPIVIGDDCWFGGNVIVLPGVSVGRGCTIGAGSVLTKDVPEFHVAVGNPARVIRKIETEMDANSSSKAQSLGVETVQAGEKNAETDRVEDVMAADAEKLEEKLSS